MQDFDERYSQLEALISVKLFDYGKKLNDLTCFAEELLFLSERLMIDNTDPAHEDQLDLFTQKLTEYRREFDTHFEELASEEL